MSIRISKYTLLFYIVLFSVWSCNKQNSNESNNLEEQFLNPPISAKPYVWWHWMDSNFSKEGITKDLEAMKESLIGDEQKPADFEWAKDRGEKMGRTMLAFPEWFIKNEPRPSQGRKTFSIWYYYRKDSPLEPSSVVGTVKPVFESEVEL